MRSHYLPATFAMHPSICPRCSHLRACLQVEKVLTKSKGGLAHDVDFDLVELSLREDAGALPRLRARGSASATRLTAPNRTLRTPAPALPRSAWRSHEPSDAAN